MSFNTTHQDFISLFPLLMSSCWPDGSPVVWRHFPNDPRKMCSGFFFFFPMNSWECNLPSWVEQFKSPNPAKLWIEILSLLNYRHLWKEKQTFSSLPQIECSSISEYSERIIKSNHLDSGKSYSTLRWQAESLSDSIIDTILQLNVQRKIIKRVDQWFQPGCCGRSWPVWNYPILFSEKNNNGRSFSVVDFLFVYSYMPATFSTLLWKAEEIRIHFAITLSSIGVHMSLKLALESTLKTFKQKNQKLYSATLSKGRASQELWWNSSWSTHFHKNTTLVQIVYKRSLFVVSFLPFSRFRIKSSISQVMTSAGIPFRRA